MATRTIGIILNGATSRIGSTQHLKNALAPLRAEGGLVVGDDRVMPRVLLVGRDADRLAALVGTAKRAAAQRQPTRGLRAADDPRAVPPDGLEMPDIGGPHPGRGLGGAGGSPDHTQLRRSR